MHQHYQVLAGQRRYKYSHRFRSLTIGNQVFLQTRCTILTKTLAIANDLESPSEPSPKMYTDNHLYHWSHVRCRVRLFMSIDVTDTGLTGSLLSVWYGW